jgi:hypothetical protein
VRPIAILVPTEEESTPCREAISREFTVAS